MNTIRFESVSKKIKKKTILDNVSITLTGGKIYGLVGKNGSGKTMILRTVAGLMKPSSGKIFYNEKELYKDIDFIPKLGMIIENIGLYPEFSGFKNLSLLAKINNCISENEIKDAIKRVGLDPEDRQPVKKYSLGMNKRIAIAQALMEHPDVLLLDEPTNALDSEGIDLIRKICSEEASRGAIVVIASHNKEDIELLCNKKYQVDCGKVDGVL